MSTRSLGHCDEKISALKSSGVLKTRFVPQNIIIGLVKFRPNSINATVSTPFLRNLLLLTVVLVYRLDMWNKQRLKI